MSLTLPRLRQDHKHVAAVLTLIEAEVDTLAADRSLNVGLIESAVLYFREYFSRFHQPKENLIFGHLVGQKVELSKRIFPLLEDHRDLLDRVKGFENALTKLQPRDPASRDDFCERAKRFVERQRAHLVAEETLFYPEAERWLTASQWAEVDNYMPGEVDPLSKSPIDPAFAALAAAMPAALGQQDSTDLREKDDREVVGIFKSPDAFQTAIDELLSSGFNRWI